MAKDMDFAPQRQRASTPKTSPILPKPPAKKSKLAIWLILFAVVLLALAFYWQFLGSESTTKKNIDNPVSQSSQSKSILSPIDTGLKVQVYDSGAGKEVLGTTVNKLKSSGYRVENMDSSQFNYDQSSIWYRKEDLDEAKKLIALFPERPFGLKEITMNGSFDLIVFLGRH